VKLAVWFCGLYPYFPDELLDVVVVELDVLAPGWLHPPASRKSERRRTRNRFVFMMDLKALRGGGRTWFLRARRGNAERPLVARGPRGPSTHPFALAW
jgi:hypothetical protein